MRSIFFLHSGKKCRYGLFPSLEGNSLIELAKLIYKLITQSVLTKVSFFLSSFLFLTNAFTQQSSTQSRDTLKIKISPQLGNQALILEDSTYIIGEDSLTFSSLRFYISKLELYQDSKLVWSEPESYHLIDASDETSYTLALNAPNKLEFDALHYQLGIDSLTNVSGAMGGDLDPTMGMYWSWNTGYINFKLEGNSPSCPTRKNAFQFHLGGYLPPFESVQTVQLAVNQSEDRKASTQEAIEIKMDLAHFLEAVDLSREHTFMSPSAEVQKLSKLASSTFYCEE